MYKSYSNMKPMLNSLTDVACSRAAVYNLALIINLGYSTQYT